MNYKIIISLGEEELLDYKNPTILEADILEIRLDLLTFPFIKEKLSSVLKELAKPILFTHRNPKDSSEAMNTKLAYEDISDILLEFNSKENYLDIEIDQEKSIFDPIPEKKYRIIYSYHNFLESVTKKEMLSWISKINKINCIYKFAVSPKNISELDNFLKDLTMISESNFVIGIAMGEIGVYSRLFGDSFGSFATYCCVGNSKAPGQINILTFKKIREEYKGKPLPEITFKIE